MAVLLPASNYSVFSCLANSCEKDNKNSTLTGVIIDRKCEKLHLFRVNFYHPSGLTEIIIIIVLNMCSDNSRTVRRL